jgi:tRNA A37 N6-isopentenylltransferase MiaA
VSATAAKALGLREIASLPRSEAIERVVVRTRRYAAYQRKWMRRIPGIRMVDAARGPGIVADEILEMLRTHASVSS